MAFSWGKLMSVAAIVLLCVRSGSCNAKQNAATREVLQILSNPDQYDNGIMALNESGPLNVGLQFYFREVDVDDVKQEVTVDMTFRMIWFDSRLKYNADVEYVTITEPELAWLPDPFFKHAISTQQQMTIMPQNYLRVHRNGTLIFSTRLIVVFSCKMDFQRFPHDDQRCNLPIASYGYTRDDLLFRFHEKDGLKYRGGSMHSTNFLVDRFVMMDHCDSRTSTGSYSCVEVVIWLERLVSSYIWEWYIPCIFLVIVAAMSEIVVATEFLSRLLLTLIPLITLCMYAVLYSLLTTASVPYSRPLDIFAFISMLVILLQLIRIMVLHYYAQRKLREERGEILPRHPRDDCFEWIIVNSDHIAKIMITVFYILFLLAYFLAYN